MYRLFTYTPSLSLWIFQLCIYSVQFAIPSWSSFPRRPPSSFPQMIWREYRKFSSIW